MGLSDYGIEPDDREFVGDCGWCGRPVREGEYVLRDRLYLQWPQRACLDCDAVLDGDLGRMEGEA